MTVLQSMLRKFAEAEGGRYRGCRRTRWSMKFDFYRLIPGAFLLFGVLITYSIVAVAQWFNLISDPQPYSQHLRSIVIVLGVLALAMNLIIYAFGL